MGAQGRITIHDLARQCGVSATTVSHAFTGRRHVEAETKARILEAASAAGYQPSRVAQALRSKRTGVIGLMLPLIDGESRHSRDFLSREYYMRVAAAAAAKAFEHGYALMLLPSAEEGGPLRSHGIDGVIICDPDDGDPRVALCRRIGLPLITLGRDETGGEDVPSVESGSAVNTALLLDHMREVRPGRIGLLSAVSRSSWLQEAERAYRAWCARTGEEPTIVHASMRKAARNDRQVMSRLLDPALRLTGVLSLEEVHGVRFLEIAREAGFEVPGDLMVAVALDGSRAQLSKPPLTAIDLKPDRQGDETVNLLVRLMKGDPSVASRLVPAEVIVRESTGAASAQPVGGLEGRARRPRPRPAREPGRAAPAARRRGSSREGEQP